MTQFLTALPIDSMLTLLRPERGRVELTRSWN